MMTEDILMQVYRTPAHQRLNYELSDLQAAAHQVVEQEIDRIRRLGPNGWFAADLVPKGNRKIDSKIVVRREGPKRIAVSFCTLSEWRSQRVATGEVGDGAHRHAH